jgi:hypothetical protein
MVGEVVVRNVDEEEEEDVGARGAWCVVHGGVELHMVIRG